MKNSFVLSKIGIALFFIINSSMISSQNLPIVLELEDGVIGNEWAIEVEDVTFATITTNLAGDHPGSAERVISLDATFPVAQAYDLYIRLRVGSNNFDDDSFFYGNGFGEKTVDNNNDWIRANGLANIGSTVANEVVSGAGAAGGGVWKWINLSEYTGDEAPVVFEVEAGQLTQTFQIGAREDGLDIDKIAFARADYFFTVSNLDNIEEGSPSDPGDEPTMPPIAEGKEKFLGSVYSQSQKVGFLNYFNQVTPENAGKWGSVEPQMDVMNWTELDSAYALAKDNDLPFRFHVMIWGNQQPAWIENLSPAEQLVQIEEWFAEVANRYPDIDFVEVVNEALHDPPNTPGSGGGNYIEALGGAGTTGWDWVINSFELARQYFPNAELLINDYNIVNSTSNTDSYLGIIDLLIEEDLIDQIGVQAHAFSTTVNEIGIENKLNLLATRGLPIYVTELDIDGPNDQIQLEEYQRIFPVFWEHPAVKGVTLWGYRVGMWRTSEGAYLIDEDGVTERPALVWLRGYIENTVLNTENPIANSSKISVFPNPATNDQTLTISGIDKISSVEIYDLTGKKVWIAELNRNTIKLNTSLSKGLYILKMYDENFAYVKKLMIQ
jgi:endo-1,4-beta-xylanase